MINKTIINTLIFLVLLSTCSCNNQKEIKKEYFSNGDLKSESQYLNGKLNGKKVVYYPNGKLNWEADYIDNKINGRYIEYNENGMIIAEAIFKNGLQNGNTTLYDSNGIVKSVIILKNGKKNGLAQSYNNSKIISEVLYHNDSVLYVKKLNAQGEVTEEYYKIVIESLCNDTIELGKKFEANIYFAGKQGKPFQITCRLKNELLSIRNIGILQQKGYYEFTPTLTGLHEFIAAIKYADNDTSTVYSKFFYVK